MFSIESYLTPYIAAYLGKYVDNFNKSNFQLSLWEGEATFQNVDLNLGAIEAELEIPFHVISGHIHEMKISVPWTKITSEPIVVTINTFELSMGLKRKRPGEEETKVNKSPIEPSLPPDTTGYMQGLMNRIIQNAKVVCRNVILKYIEEDIVISFNFENVTLCSVNSCWEQAFVDFGGTDFIVRRKLRCPDLTVCLDNVHSVSRHSYMEPLLYKCAFDVRILNQFQGPFSRTPFFRRIDILFNEADVSVSEQQIPMLIRLYNLLIALTQLKGPQSDLVTTEPRQGGGDILIDDKEEEKCETETKAEEEPLPCTPPPECSMELVCVEEEMSSPLYDWAAWAVGWIPLGGFVASDEPPPEPLTPTPQIQPILALGLYVNAAHCTLKKSEQQRFSDRASTSSSTPSSRIKAKPYLKIHIQGIVADISVQGPARSVRGGFCEVRVDGVGVCPCGVDDGGDERSSSPLPSAGIPYSVMGRKRDDFLTGTLFDPDTDPAYDAFDCRFHCKGYEDRYSEDSMLIRTPAIALDSVEILPTSSSPDECCEGGPEDTGVLPTPADSNFRIAFEKEGPKTSTRVVFSPLSIRVSTGLVHRFKVIQKALEAYNYIPYVNLLPLYIPELRLFMKLRVDRLELVFCDSESSLLSETNNEMRLTLFGIKTNLDVKEFYRKKYFQLRGLDLQSYQKEADDWVKGHCMGIVVSSTQGVDPQIEIPSGMPTSSTSFELHQPTEALRRPKGPAIKMDTRTDRALESFLAFSYTEVQASHYLKTNHSSELPNSWNELLRRKLGPESQLLLAYNHDPTRLVTEIDLKMKSVDIFLHPATVDPMVPLTKEILSLSVGTAESSAKSNYTSINMPMAYIETQRIRLFLRTVTEPSEKAFGDVLLVQVPGVYLTSQVDNALERQCLRPDLLGLGEEAGITMLPGSFLEDRRYELFVPHLSLSTCNWEDLESATLGQKETVIAYPLFQHSELSVAFSPALVFQGSSTSDQILVAGYGAQMNFSREIHITASTHQLALLLRLASDWIGIKNSWKGVTTYQVESIFSWLDLRQGISDAEWEGSKEPWEGSVKEVDSGVGAESTNTIHQAEVETAPIDYFLAAANVRITVFHLEYAVDPESNTFQMAALKPLLMLNILRPYCATSISVRSQKMDFSIFDLTIAMGDGNSRPLEEFMVPRKSDFPVHVLETLPGERNPKTGLLRPLLNISSLDFFIQNVNLRCEVGRPVKFILCMERFYQLAELWVRIAEETGPNAPPEFPPPDPPPDLNIHRLIALVASYTQRLQVYATQIVVVIAEEPPGLTKAAITTSLAGLDLSLRGSDVTNSAQLPSDWTRIKLGFETITMTTLLGDRTDMLLNPMSFHLHLTLEWNPFIDVPLIAINLCPGPVRVFFGPQNILAILQVYHTFGYYWEKFVEVEEKELVEILEETVSTKEEVSFEDDLRNGAFHFYYSTAPSSVPPVYQVGICREEKTITWRYPHPRSIQAILTHPLPLNRAPTQSTEVECSLNCWSEADSGFVFVGSFVIHDCIAEEVVFGEEEGNEHVSSLWRVTLLTPMEEEDLQRTMRPDGVVASLYIKSSFARHKVPKLHFIARIPSTTIHFINHRTYAGKIPEERLGMYSIEGLQTQMDQPFATIHFSHVIATASMWIQRARAELKATTHVTVTDYEYLTDMTVVEPFLTRATYNLLEETSIKVHEGFGIMFEKLCIKVGSSALHTITTSTLCWIQVLKAYYGDVVDTSRAHFQPSISMARIMIANDTAFHLNLKQVLTKKPLLIPSGSAYAFAWTTQKVKPELTLALTEEPTKETAPFSLRRPETLARQLGDSHLFITSKYLHPAQLLVTVGGSLDVANGLDVAVEVGLLGKRMSQERCWRVESGCHGPSLLLPAHEVAGIRFRLTNVNGRQHGWSHSVTLEELGSLPQQSRVVTLYEEREGVLVDLNIWCSLVEEGLDGGRRCLLLLLPLFRLASFLPTPTTATIAEPGNASRTSVVLPGRGSKAEVDFRGQATAAHLLTFQSDAFSEASTPIPLVAGGGPCLETPPPKPPIDSILDDLLRRDIGDLKRPWPFTRENMDGTDWAEGPRSDGPVKVSFKPWIPGFPSVVVQVKPAAMLVNLTGQTLLFRQEGDDLSISNKTVFSPNNIHGKFAFGFNLNLLGGSGVVWSEELEMSDHPGPAQIHHVNSDWKIPVNCLSRLELNGHKMQVHVTIEVTVFEGITLVVLRPTFNIQNKTPFTLSVSGLSLQGDGKKVEKMIGPMDKTYQPIDGQDAGNTGDPGSAYPLLLFNCDWNPKERNIYTSGVKYLALKYSESPAWLIRLIKFEQIFDNISAPQGIPVNQLTTAIPTVQPHWIQGKPRETVEVAMPISVSWTSKDGQVWISIQLDSSPQVVLVNESNIPLCFLDPESLSRGHYQNYWQLPILSPFATSFYTFRQNTFPEVQTIQAELHFGLFPLPEKNFRLTTMLHDLKRIDWSPPVKCEDSEEVQLLLLGTEPSKVYLKVLTEKLGPVYYIVVEELSDAEVSARDVRSRIQEELTQCSQTTVVMENEVSTSTFASSLQTIFRNSQIFNDGFGLVLSEDELAASIVKSTFALDVARSSVSKSEIETDVGTAKNPFVELRIHLPQIRLILTNDLSGLGIRREILSLTLNDLFFEKRSKHGERRLRVLGNKPSESWLLRVLLGDFQVDNALSQEKRCDFPVILQREEIYESTGVPCLFETPKDFDCCVDETFLSRGALLEVGGEFLITKPEGLPHLQSLEVKCQPVRLNLEEKFLVNIVPLTFEVAAVVRERLPLLQTQTQILQAQRLERHSRESLQFIMLPLTRKNTELLESKFQTSEVSVAASVSGTATVELVGARRLSWSGPSTPIESPGLRSPSSEDVRSLVAVPMETDLGVGPLYGDIGKDYVQSIIDGDQNASDLTSPQEEGVNMEVLSGKLLGAMERSKTVTIPDEVRWILEDVCQPIQLQRLHVHQVQTYLTFRGTYAGLYFAFDNSPILLNEYVAHQLLTTRFNLGQTLGGHFLLGAIYRAGNPMRMLASLELIGSPGSLARTLGTGVKDFVVYPLRGVREGPLAFVAGLNSGSSSLLRNFTAGTLTSVTNLAWSVSRNLDRWTLDELEEEMAEDSRRIPIDGISDGLVHGLSAFGIRLLGAIGGVLHHPLQAAIDDGASPFKIAKGLGKGLIGVVTKPVGATVELVAMTGQGILQEAGWAQKFTRKEDVFVEDTSDTLNSGLKYRWKLGLTDREPWQEKLLLVVEGVELDGRGRPTLVSLLITTEHVLVMDTSLDQVRRRESISSSVMQPTDFELDSSVATEFFTLLGVLKKMHSDDLFKLFPKSHRGESNQMISK